MKRLYYRTEQFEKVSACGMECEFNDMRIDRSTVPKGKYQYQYQQQREIKLANSAFLCYCLFDNRKQFTR